MSVLDAIEAFSSELRVRLIRHYLEHPGHQVDAAAALGVNGATINRHTAALVRIGVVREERDASNRRFVLCSVDVARYDELLRVLHAFIHAPERTPIDD